MKRVILTVMVCSNGRNAAHWLLDVKAWMHELKLNLNLNILSIYACYVNHYIHTEVLKFSGVATIRIVDSCTY